MKKTTEEKNKPLGWKQAVLGWCGALLLLLCWPAPSWAEAYYICAGGETASQIAEQTGVSEQLLRAANNGEEQEVFEAGQLLRIPTDLIFTVTVESGDTLYSLAEQYGVTLEQLLDYNNVNPTRLRVGMQLSIPIGEEVSAISNANQALPVLATLASRSARMQYPVVGVVSSRFGSRWGAFHYGLDLAADQGARVSAASGGLVTEAGWKNDAYGYAVMIDHGNGMETLYGHCSEVLVETGQQVRSGEAIALVGSTGNSTGPHVHFEVRINGECQDPLDYL